MLQDTIQDTQVNCAIMFVVIGYMVTIKRHLAIFSIQFEMFMDEIDAKVNSGITDQMKSKWLGVIFKMFLSTKISNSLPQT